MAITAEDVLSVMRSWLGLSQAAGTHKVIIDTYNAYTPLPYGYKVKYTDQYCCTTVSAAFIKLGAADLIGGPECAVERHVKIFRQMGIWEEDGSITPEKGWLIVYNWDGSAQPNNGYSDHIGVVENVSGGRENQQITSIEGNVRGGTVGRVVTPVGHGSIRGFAKPKYGEAGKSTETPTAPAPAPTRDEIAKEVIHGKWGKGADRRARLTAAGYDYDAVQEKVNELLGKPVQATPQTPTGEEATLKLPILGLGAKGVPVRAMQALLIEVHLISCGKHGIDGEFGSGTLQGVRTFKRRYGLKDDGICDINTWRKLLGV